jgi:two-component system, OmpR family, response regulator
MYTDNKSPTNLSSLKGLRVLVVDNNIDYCDLIKVLLQTYGVLVQTAFLARQALEIFRQWEPDVIMSDIALPYEDGYTLIQQVRTKAGEKGEAVLAIAVTGYADEKMLQYALNTGFDLWFIKPLDFDEFLTILACLVICQQSSYTVAQQILGNMSRHRRINFEKQLDLGLPA